MPGGKSVSRLSRAALAVAAALLPALLALAQSPRSGIGQPATEQQIAGWNIDIAPDGAGLPTGHGTVRDGEQVYAEVCASCHGERGQGGSANPGPPLVGGRGTLITAQPIKTVGSYWLYATTLFDYIRRAMPYNAPQSLSADQTYSVAAYILHLNGIVGEDAELDANTLPKIQMPNRAGFENAYEEQGKGRWR